MEHSGLVAIYADQIAGVLGWDGDRAALMRACLSHDWPEVESGDMPGPFKRAAVDDAKLSEYEDQVYDRRFGGNPNNDDDPMIGHMLKTADILEAVLFLVSERRLGNQGVVSVLLSNYALLVKSLNNYPLRGRQNLMFLINKAIRDEWEGQDGVLDPELEAAGGMLKGVIAI